MVYESVYNIGLVEDRVVVVIRPSGFAEALEIYRYDTMIACQRIENSMPCIGRGPEAMEQDKSGIAGSACIQVAHVKIGAVRVGEGERLADI